MEGPILAGFAPHFIVIRRSRTGQCGNGLQASGEREKSGAEVYKRY
jgi:hypothetical protein